MSRIHKAVLAIIEDLGFIPKSKQFSQGGTQYKYRGIEQVLIALQPLLVKHSVIIEPRVVSKEYDEKESKHGGGLILARVNVDYTFTHADDDSKFVVTFAGEAMDSSDKATTKAQSAAYKAMAFYTFCVPTEEGEKEDQDKDRHEIKATSERMPPPTPRKEERKSYTQQAPKEEIVTVDQWTAMRSTARENKWPPAEITKFITERKAAKKPDMAIYNEGRLFFSRPYVNPDEIQGEG